MKKTLVFVVAALAVCFQLASSSAFGQVATQPIGSGGTATSTTAMACAADRLFVAESSQGIWQFCTGRDGKPMGFNMDAVQNIGQMYHQNNGVLTSYGTDGLIRQYSVVHGQQYIQFQGDWPVQQGGRITSVDGQAISITFPWSYRSGQIYLYNSGGDFGFFSRLQSEPYYVLAVRNAAGLYGVSSNGELWHHELMFGNVLRQSTLVMKGVAAIAAPSPTSQTLYVATQAQFDCGDLPGVYNTCRVVQAGSIVKVKYDRWATRPYSTEVVLSGVYPAAMWPNTTMVCTESSVYFIEQHPVAGSRVVGYSNKAGSGITILIDKNSGFFRGDQGKPAEPWFGAIALAATQ